MGLLNLTVNDDAAERDSTGDVDISGATAVFSSFSTNKQHVGFRFTGVTIPQGATINHAVLKVDARSFATAGSTNITCKAEASDNAAAFTTTNSDLSNRTLGTASKATLISDLDSRVLPIDVTALVQEVVNRGGWSSGNALNIQFLSPPALTTCTFQMKDGLGVDATLDIIYNETADSVRSPSVSGTGAFTNPNNAFSSNNSYATLANTTSGQQIWESFGIADLTGNTILGILVKVEGKVSSESQRSTYEVELSWDGGTTWTTAKQTESFATTDLTRMYGGADQWSHSFTPSELTNANFKVRVTCDFASATNDASIDYVSVQVFYAASGATTYTKTIQAKARMLVAGVTKTVTAKSRIKITGVTKTVTAKAKIIILQTKTIQALARMKVLGVTKTVTAKARAKVLDITKTVTSKARIKILANDKTIQAKTRMKVLGNDKSIQAKARVKNTLTQTVTAKARIAAVTATKTIDAKARIKQIDITKTIQAKARIKIIDQTKTIQAKSRILTAGVSKTIQAKARIKVSDIVQTITARGRLKIADIVKTLIAKSRIKIADIGNTITAKSRILKVISQTIQAKGDIKVFDVTRTVTVKASISTPGTTQTIQAKADILVLGTTKTINSKARIKRTVSYGEGFLTAQTASRNTLAQLDGAASSGDATFWGQAIDSGSDQCILNWVAFYLKKTGTPHGWLRVVVYAHTGTYGTDGKPTGLPLAYSDMRRANNDLTTSEQLIRFMFSGSNRLTLPPNTKYVFGVEYINHYAPADSYVGTGTTNGFLDNSNNGYFGQTVTGNGQILDNLEVKLQKYVGSPTGNAVAKVYAITGTHGTDGKPTGSVLATSDNFEVSRLGSNYQWAKFRFSGANRITLANGTHYAVYVDVTGAAGVNGSNFIRIEYDSSSPTHSGNMFWFDLVTVQTSSSYDLSFKLNCYAASEADDDGGSDGAVIGINNTGTLSGNASNSTDGGETFTAFGSYDLPHQWQAWYSDGLNYFESLNVRAKILVLNEKTIQAKGRLKVLGVGQTLTAKARIGGTHDATIDAKARIKVIVSKTIQAKARIKIVNQSQIISAKARIKIVVEKTIQAKARILVVQNQNIQAKARLKQFDVTKTLTAKARILISYTNTISAKAKIVLTESKTISAKANLRGTTNRTTQVKAMIQTEGARNISAKADIKQIDITKSLTARGRILVVQNKTIESKAAIKNLNVTKSITAKARLALGGTMTADAKARIKILGNDKAIQAKGRIKKIDITKTIQSKARVFRMVENSIQAKGRIKIAGLTYLITCRARIKGTATKTLTARARLWQARLNVIRGIRGTLTSQYGVKSMTFQGVRGALNTQYGVKSATGQAVRGDPQVIYATKVDKQG